MPSRISALLLAQKYAPEKTGDMAGYTAKGTIRKEGGRHRHLGDAAFLELFDPARESSTSCRSFHFEKLYMRSLNGT